MGISSFTAAKKSHVAKRRIAPLALGTALAALVMLPATAQAAQLLLSPSSGSREVGGVFAVSIYVSTPSKAMNAASGIVTFPPALLEIASLSKDNSIMDLWVREPFFSNREGTLQFEGVALNPGYTGSSGKILTVYFRAKVPGVAEVSFARGEVLANDGVGNDILTDMSRARFTLAPRAAPSETKKARAPAGQNAGPRLSVSSPTHPDPARWYQAQDALFEWKVPDGAQAVRTLMDHNPYSTPLVEYAPPIGRKLVKDLEDGVWYFHAQAKDDRGWGPPAHFKVRIDTEPPSVLRVTELPRPSAAEPPRFSVEAQDERSGIGKLEVVEGEERYIIAEEGKAEFAPRSRKAGEQLLLVRAYDRAGNYRDTTVAYVMPEPSAAGGTRKEEPQRGAPSRELTFMLFASLLLLWVAFLLLLGSYARQRLLRRRITREVHTAHRRVADVFQVLRDELDEWSGTGAGRAAAHLTKRERERIARLRRHLRFAARRLDTSLSRIEEEVRK